MARVLSTNLQADVVKTITTPAYLVQIDFSTVLRLSTRNDQSWNSQVWSGGRLDKVQATDDGGQIELMNGDLLAGALVLNEGVADRDITVWKFYGDNPDVGDVVQVFSGVGDTVEIAHDRVRIRLALSSRRTLYSPRRFINATSGFNHLLPEGTKITWGNDVFTLER